MRKIFTLFTLVLVCNGLYAQIWQSENFNGCALPAGWTENILSGTQGWLFVDQSPDAFNIGNIDGTCMLLFDDDWLGSAAAPSSVELIGPAVDLSGLPSVLMEFDYNLQEYGPAAGDGFTVDVWDGSTWVNVFSRLDVNDCGAWSCGPPYPHAVVDVTAYANPAFQVRISYFDGGGWSWYFGFDNYVLFTPPANDVGVSAVLQPIEGGCSAGPAEPVEVTISNYGSADASGFDVCFIVDGPTGLSTVCENVGALTITPGATANFLFSGTADLSLPGIYSVTGYTAMVGDGIPENDSSTIGFNLSLITPTYTENFNSYADGATVFLDFTNETYDQRQWEVNIGTTSSAGTGPSSGAGGSGGYIYIESSGTFAGDSAVLSSRCIDLSSLSAPVFEFAYHMFGPAIDYIRVEAVDGAGVATEIYMLVGQQQFANADPWLYAVADLSPWAGSIIQLRITGKIKLGSDGFTFTADMALDDFVIREISADDLGITAIFSPVAGGCFGGTTESINVEIGNFGSADQSAFDVCYELDGPSGLFSACENVGALTVTALDGTATYTFASTVDLSLPGLYDLLVYTSLPTDGDNSNDSLSTTVELFGALSTYPYLETFDSYTNCGDALFACALNGSCASSVSGGWEQELSDNMDWSITNLLSTPSAGTGPTAGDHTSGFGRYLFTESSGCLLQRAGLISPCFDLDALTCPEVSFWYHMLGTNQGTMTLDIDTGTGVWLNLWSISGNQGSEWLETRVPLADYIGQVVRFRISGLTGSGFLSDMAIDDFSISDKSQDVGVISVDSPASGCEVGVSDVTVTLVNGSCVTAPAFDVVLEIDGISIVTDTYPAGLAGLSTVSHTFSVPFDFEAPGSYAITSYTILAGDLYPENDEAESIVASLEPPAVNTGFEASYCLGEDNIFPSPLYPGGTWSGTGIVDPSTGELDPSVIGAGNSTDITYTFVPTGSYSVAEIPYGPEVVSSPNFVFLGDDAFTGVPVGFSFEYFGNSYTNINIHSNGFLSFGATSTPTVAQFFPNPLAPNNVLAVAWDDWNPNDGGTISYATEGSAPNRKFIVDFTDLPHFGSAGALTMTTQVILYEGLNFIDYQVTRVEADAGNRTQGIENADGTEAYTSTPLTNLSNWTQDLIAYRYAPTSCGNVVTETISIDELASIGLDPTLAICAGVEGILDAGPGALSYSWSTGDTTQTITVTTPGTYSVTVLDSLGCFAGDEVVVSFSTVLTIDFDVLNATIGSSNGQALAIVTGGTPPFTYLWSDGQTTNPAFNLPAGSYEVTVTDALGCTVVGTVEVDEVSGLNGIKGLSLLEIYPNPSAGSFQVQVELSNAESVRLEIYNPLGQLVRSLGEETIVGKVWDLDLSTEAAGTYQIRIIIGDQFLSRNVVINR